MFVVIYWKKINEISLNHDIDARQRKTRVISSMSDFSERESRSVSRAEKRDKLHVQLLCRKQDKYDQTWTNTTKTFDIRGNKNPQRADNSFTK